MSISVDKLEHAIEEAQRFIRIAAKARNRMVKEFNDFKERRKAEGSTVENRLLPDWNICCGTRETGAAKRASMDLQQALVELRK